MSKIMTISLIISIHLPQQISEGFYKINLSAHCPMFLNNLWCMVICTVHAAVQLFFQIAFHCSRRSICKKCHNGEKNKLIIRVVRNLKIYTTVCSDVLLLQLRLSLYATLLIKFRGERHVYRRADVNLQTKHLTVQTLLLHLSPWTLPGSVNLLRGQSI